MAESANSATSLVGVVPVAATASVIDIGSFGGLMPVSAEHALPVALPVVDQDALLVGIEARLTEEMRGLALSLAEFGRRTKAIREEIPDDAKFGKLVAGSLPMTAFQLADAILRVPHGFTFKNDGALYLQQLGLEFKDFVREIDLEGRKFLAVAFLDKSGCDVLDRTPNGDEL